MKTAKSIIELRRLLFLFFLSVANLTHAQFYDNGQDRFQRMSHIKTQHFDIIFPSTESQLGQLYANHLEQIYKSGGQSLGWNPKRIPVAIRPSVAYANGEVVWAPRRMNLFSTASPDSYFQRWDEQLSLHEFRHVVQTDKLDQGASHFFSCLLGEQYIGLLLGIHVPYWFLEGDAVTYETGASTAGRGRIADFENELAAQVAQKGIWHYHKAIFDSYADNVPSKYHLGYQLINYGRCNYGTGLWQNCLNRVAIHPISLRPFGRAIKDATGLREPVFYKKALEPLLTKTKAEPDNSIFITKCKSNNYTSYYYPQTINGKTIAYRENFTDIGAIVEIDQNGKEKIIKHIGQTPIKHISSSNNLIVWNQLRPTRWELFNHNQITIYNIDKNRGKTIARRGRYYCSTLSHTSQLIASACYSNNNHWSITIHDTKGRLKQQIPLQDAVPCRIAWTENDDCISIIVNSNNSKSILKFNTGSQKCDTILSNICDDISNLILADGKLFFTGNNKGTTAWYSYSPNDKKCHIVAESGFGTGSGSIHGDTLTFTYYTADGYMIARKNINENLKECQIPTTRETAFTENLAKQELQVEFKNDSNFNVKHYSRLAHLFNIHSWGPISVRVDDNEIGPGITIMSQDALSTSFLTAGYQYYFADDINNIFAEYQYKGFYPLFGIRGDLKYYDINISDNRGYIHTLNCKQRDLSVFARLPMILKSNVFTTSAYIQTSIQMRNHIIEGQKIRYHSDTCHHTMTHSAFLQSLRRTSYRDLQPRWGFYIKADYMHYMKGESTDYQTAIQGRIYLPGLAANHGFSVYGSYQKRGKDDLIFSNIVLYPRGCKSVSNTEFKSLLTSYTMPVCYPDLAIGNALYVKRIKTTLFYDFARIQSDNTYDLKSTGIDATADFHVFRIAVPFSMGMRYARLINNNDNYFGLLFSMNFSAMY